MSTIEDCAADIRGRLETFPDRNSWLSARRTGIGGSDTAAALGVNPWKSPSELWAEKTGMVEPDDLSEVEAVEWGLRLERPVGEGYASRTGREVAFSPPNSFRRHDNCDFLFASPDAFQIDRPNDPLGLDLGDLQIKTASAFKASDFKDDFPLYYQVQVQTELAVTGLDWGTLAVLLGGQKLMWFDVERNDDFIAVMIERLAEFWKLVETKTPPPVDGSEATARALSKLYPRERGDEVFLPTEAADWDVELAYIREKTSELEAREKLLKNQLKALIGNASYGVLPNGYRWAWKMRHRSATGPCDYRELRRVK